MSIEYHQFFNTLKNLLEYISKLKIKNFISFNQESNPIFKVLHSSSFEIDLSHELFSSHH